MGAGQEVGIIVIICLLGFISVGFSVMITEKMGIETIIGPNPTAIITTVTAVCMGGAVMMVPIWYCSKN
jgi:hypothetical protein